MEKYTIYLVKKDKLKVKNVHLINRSSNKKEIFKLAKKYIEGKKIAKEDLNRYEIALIKFEKVKYNPNQPIKMVFGPYKISIEFLQITNRYSAKKDEKEKKNNHLFITENYLDSSHSTKLNGFNYKKYFKKMIIMAYENKLEKRLLAPKTIDQLI